MKWTIEYIEHGNYFKVVNEGIFEPGDSTRLYQNLFSNKFWKLNTSILMDNRLVDYRNVSYRVISDSSFNLAKNEDQIGESKIGYLVESQIGYGASRQLQMLLEGKSSIKIEVFTDEEKAVTWLTENQTANE
jgi:hypothetical protein